MSIPILNLETALVNPNTLALHPSNPRIGDLDALRASFESTGFYGTVIVNLTTGHVVAGNHRVKAACSLGMVEIPVTYIRVSEEEESRILLADNRTSALGHDDDSLIMSHLQRLREAPKGLRGTGYTDKAVEKIQERIHKARERESGASPRPARAEKIQAGRVAISATQEEMEALLERLTAYKRRAGTDVGFVSEVLGLAPPILPSKSGPASA